MHRNYPSSSHPLLHLFDVITTDVRIHVQMILWGNTARFVVHIPQKLQCDYGNDDSCQFPEGDKGKPQHVRMSHIDKGKTEDGPDEWYGCNQHSHIPLSFPVGIPSGHSSHEYSFTKLKYSFYFLFPEEFSSLND